VDEYELGLDFKQRMTMQWSYNDHAYDPDKVGSWNVSFTFEGGRC
jgi:hypothetical protein